MEKLPARIDTERRDPLVRRVEPVIRDIRHIRPIRQIRQIRKVRQIREVDSQRARRRSGFDGGWGVRRAVVAPLRVIRASRVRASGLV